jgi:hypothetical protein|tara:strand:- start:408 stop:743 length:336 start_codon:yes stop_codon:yes gene_type:complete
MAQVFKYVQGDTGPQIRVTLTNEDDNAPVDLTSATVTLHFREAGAESVLFSRAFFINPDTASNGVAVLQWATDDLEVDAGTYEGEIEVVRSSGVRETLFDKLKFKIREDFA